MYDKPSSQAHLLNEIENAMEFHSYGSGKIVLIGGKEADYGDDPGEIVIKNGIVLAVIREISNKSDLAILELADAINKACENVTASD
jgi:hypothetical protein